MAPTRPSLQTLIDRAIGDMSSRTEGSAYLQDAPERVIAIVNAGLANGAYGMLEAVKKELSPVSCGTEMLLRWGSIAKVTRNPATAAVRTVAFTGANGTALPADTTLQGPDGSQWMVAADGTVSGGSVTITATADVAGKANNLDVGAAFAVVVPIAGIDTSSGVVASVVSDGVDLEDIEDYRVRVLDELRDPESGGGIGDYVKWAKRVPGVTRAWEFGGRMGYGTVSIAFVRDDDTSLGSPDIVPDAGEIALVQALIDALKPLDMRAAYVQAPVLKPVTITIAPVPNTTAVKAAIKAELVALFRDEADLETAMPLSRIDEAISQAEGETSHTITAISSLVPGTWELLTIAASDITWA